MVLYAPRIIPIIYLKLSSRHQRAQVTVERYLNKMVEQEMAESPDSIAQRKKTSLIASLVSALQTDEKAEAKKKEEDKKGKIYS
ncbi:unnamed protein product [Rotaria sp. Silwood1]|nr:unnamed protein product [Rotaria sp. Silwood1]